MTDMTSSAGAVMAHDVAGHNHDPHLAHHFDTPDQQYQSGKLAMWVFLATEILMFGGLFCAYAVYRHNHPEVFAFAHQYLDRTLGATNTLVLIASSFTMAWAVRCSQLGYQKALRILLALTFLGGVGFMGIKTIEYKAKWKHHVFVGSKNRYRSDSLKGEGNPVGPSTEFEEEGTVEQPGENKIEEHATAPGAPANSSAQTETQTSGVAATTYGREIVDGNAGNGDKALIRPNYADPQGLAAGVAAGSHPEVTYAQLSSADRQNVFTFFSIYFMMTGLHGVHVLVGMALIAWVYLRAGRGEFGPKFFTPVDLVGLYWHLVDLIWIFLFPLLYLIH